MIDAVACGCPVERTNKRCDCPFHRTNETDYDVVWIEVTSLKVGRGLLFWKQQGCDSHDFCHRALMICRFGDGRVSSLGFEVTAADVEKAAAEKQELAFVVSPAQA